MNARTRTLTTILLLVATAGCAKPADAEPAKSPEPATEPSGGETQVANPASVHCREQGGTLEIVDGPEGQHGVCTLKDGTVCEEWAYLRGECPPEAATPAGLE